jgi:hypothetical protein
MSYGIFLFLLYVTFFYFKEFNATSGASAMRFYMHLYKYQLLLGNDDT